MQVLYELLFVLAYLIYAPKAWLRKRLPHAGWTMRLGRYPEALRCRLGGRASLWVHAVSVGEVLAARPLLAALAKALPDQQVLSSITPGGFELAGKQAAERGAAIYWPFDLRGPVRRAFDLVQPRALILMESELWPTVIREAASRKVPVAIVNGRISERAFARYARIRGLMRGMLGQVSLYLMQSEADARRARELGAAPARVHVVGSLKWDASIGTRPAEADVQAARERFGLSAEDRVIVAGSTHRGEEASLIEALCALRSRWPRLRMILAPRHIERADEVEALARRAGLSTARWSKGAAGVWDAAVIDVFGQLPALYAAGDIAYIGGSLIPHGGQNPLEAASSGKPALFGPWTHNFHEITDALIKAEACVRLADAKALGPAIGELLEDPERARRMGSNARAVTERSQGATQRTLELLWPILRSAGRGLIK